MNWEVLQDGVVVLAVAMVFGAVAERLKQSAIVGYMLAGVIVGPAVTGVIDDKDDSIVNIAQLGVTLLMFTIGLEFSWSKLRRLGLKAVAAGALQIGLTLGLAVLICRLFGVSFTAGIAIGAAVAMSSTGVVMPALARAGDVDSTHGRFALGILLVQDAAVVPAILLVAALGGEGSVGQVLGETAISFLIVGGFIAFFAAFSAYVLPALVRFVAPTHNREMPALFAIIASMGAALAAHLCDLSPALGAFIAAIFLGESIIATQLRGDLGALKVIFVTLFFASIGMLADPVWMFENVGLVLVATGLVMGAKPLVVYTVGKVMGLTHRAALSAGVCMGQVGVFSFVLAQIALDGGVIGDTLFNVVVSVAIVTLFATPYLVRFAPGLGMRYERVLRKLGLVRRGGGEEATSAKKLAAHTVVVGFGPAGRAVADRVSRTGEAVVVVDLNPTSVLAARQQGMRAYVGDASNPDLLKLMQLPDADALVVTLPDHRLTVGVIVEARQVAPKVRVIARSRYHRYVDLLEAAGADVVVDEEANVGERLAEALSLNQRLIATGDTKQEVLKETPKPAPASAPSPASAV
ncbi:MAG: cation:proton antiporter [Planctomycetota bacterium]